MLLTFESKAAKVTVGYVSELVVLRGKSLHIKVFSTNMVL